MDQSRPLVCLFSPFSHYNFNYTNWKKHRWCAWDLNPWPQDGRCRRYHGAMASAPNSQYHKKPSVVDINQHSMIVIHVLVFYWLENCLHHDSWEFIRLSTGYKLFCPFDSLSRHLIFYFVSGSFLLPFHTSRYNVKWRGFLPIVVFRIESVPKRTACDRIRFGPKWPPIGRSDLAQDAPVLRVQDGGSWWVYPMLE